MTVLGLLNTVSDHLLAVATDKASGASTLNPKP